MVVVELINVVVDVLGTVVLIWIVLEAIEVVIDAVLAVVTWGRIVDVALMVDVVLEMNVVLVVLLNKGNIVVRVESNMMFIFDVD